MRYHWGLAVGHTYATPHLGPSNCNARSGLPGMSLGSQSTSDQASEEEYEVERLIASRIRRGKLQYKVHWKGYTHEEDTWELEEHLTHSTNLIDRFHQDNPSSPVA
jgi:hypothetical protein